MVLWEGYKREEASWVKEEQLLQPFGNFMLCLHNYTCAILYSSHFSSNRCYLSPVVDEEVIHTCVSNLTSSICNSLSVGIVRNCRFSVSSRTDVFVVVWW